MYIEVSGYEIITEEFNIINGKEEIISSVLMPSIMPLPVQRLYTYK
jgi:hypothetical protein